MLLFRLFFDNLLPAFLAAGSGSLIAWRQSVASSAPFTRLLVGDLDPSKTEACGVRLKAAGAVVARFPEQLAISLRSPSRLPLSGSEK